MLTIEQVLSCDLCGREIRRIKRAVSANCVNEVINGPEMRISTASKDVCADCHGPLMEAFRHIKLQNEMKVPE